MRVHFIKTVILLTAVSVSVSCSKKEDQPKDQAVTEAKAEVTSDATSEKTPVRKAASPETSAQVEELKSEASNEESHESAGPQKLSKELRKQYRTYFAKYRCLTCHSDKNRVVGPPYRDVAKKYLPDYYKNTTELITRLTAKVKKGGSGNWGKVIMSPHPSVPEEDLHKMIHYVMSLKFSGRSEMEEKLKQTTAK